MYFLSCEASLYLCVRLSDINSISLNQINVRTVDKFRAILQYTVIFQIYSEKIIKEITQKNNLLTNLTTISVMNALSKARMDDAHQ